MGKNITINGKTYNNIESVSVNGNVFGEGSSEYTEEVLRRNFNPGGQSFIDTVSINLAAGDYIEAQFDNTNATNTNNVLSVGSDISKYPSAKHPCYGIYIYSKSDEAGHYAIVWLKANSTNGMEANHLNRDKMQTGSKTKIKISSSGVYYDDVLILPSEITDRRVGQSEDVPVSSIMEDLMTAQTLQIGAAESDKGIYSYAYYDYIKVFRRN